MPDDEHPSASAQVSAGQPWLAHYAPGVPHEIPITDEVLPHLLDESVRHFGARLALEYFGTKITYAQLGSLVDRFARALVSLGVERGDRVAVVLPNCPQFPIAFYGALKAGATVVPTNPLYTAHELQHQFGNSGAKVVILMDTMLGSMAEVWDDTPVAHVITTGVEEYFPVPLALAYRLKTASESIGKRKPSTQQFKARGMLHTMKDLIGHAAHAGGFEVFALPEAGKADDLAVLQYTGGTTGLPKGAMLTHRNLVTNARQVWAWSELSSAEHHVTLCIAPFFHVYGLTVCMNMSVAYGATMVLLPRFASHEALQAIERYKPTLFPGVPAMYMALARAVEKTPADLSSIRICISGSAPLPLEVQQAFERVSGATVVEGYGLSEASPVTHANPISAGRRIGTIGLPISNTDAAIRDLESGNFLPVGEQGEIVVRGPQVMRGYWQRPDETAETLLEGGWLRTGDIGSMSDDGYFTVVDRVKDMIIVGGLKVYPRQVEDVLFQHPKVAEATVFGLNSGPRGEEVVAVVVPKPDVQVTAQEIIEFCRKELAPYKVPRRVEFRESLPKTIVGKVLRRELRDELIAKQATPSGQGTSQA
ncbi:MAG TPA: long-chain fatty acid--CoA ligase [Ktedonobacterales bacterium]